MTDARPLGAEEATFIAAVRSGDTARFALITERHRRELQVHCYRMLASYEDAQDMTQETLLRAWNKRESFKGHAALRTWLYRIATNVCLDFLEKRNDRTPVPGVVVNGDAVNITNTMGRSQKRDLSSNWFSACVTGFQMLGVSSRRRRRNGDGAPCLLGSDPLRSSSRAGGCSCPCALAMRP